MPPGFNYKGNEYFYIRGLAGNIEKIIDNEGIIKVEYNYDALSDILKVIGDPIIINANNFLYKGYYYDFETKMYYCNSRYYDSSICRWISADDISYLEPDNINGLNLWSYCGNNLLKE